ncbi:MAG TPA: SMP-30/gluconolactonase/LRE family protein [Burkholderiales bacterium]|jgi:DNA-binding beta-propeller fold protein YncE|nr:SMP-30/gluconolactonase/LRE family protein [Burkholderiales bacterium]
MIANRIRCLLFAVLALACTAAFAWDRGAVQRFGTLPPGAFNPEGIAVDPWNGDVYATGFNPAGVPGGEIYIFDDTGRFKRTLKVPASSSALLGLDFHPQTHALLVIDFGAGKVLDVNPHTGGSSVFMTATSGDGLNALTFDHAGNVYVSASFTGVVYKTGPSGGASSVWKQDPLLTTTGFPPFGANGLQFNRHETALFVANTGNDAVVRIENAGATGGAASVFTNSINGADGLMIDEDDNVWVCANQADEIVVTDPTGKAIAKLGDFDGVKNGSPVGLLFPASLARHDGWVYITNLSLDLRPVVGQQSVDSQWAAQVTRHTISRIRARIPH